MPILSKVKQKLSPSKYKKSKPFKFPSKKEKREKSREKECKDKESDKDKKKSDDKEKEKKKEAKSKLKLKEKKKPKHNEELIDISEDLPIFGVPLSVAVERSKCHDGVDIPLVIRNCIDYVQETGLLAENVYKVSGIKSRVQQVRRMYNNHEPVCMGDFDLPVATSLLKQFLRELPEPVLTTDLLAKFEEAAAAKDVTTRGTLLKELVDQLPSCNRALLGWLLKHLDSVAEHEKHNKMNAQNISVTLSPLLQTSQRLLSALLCHVSDLFQDVCLNKYVPPLSSVSPGLPDSSEGIAVELAKQESLLSQLHKEMNQGLVSRGREEQLWEVQRIITQLKRKLRALERTSGQRSLDEGDTSLRLEEASINSNVEFAFKKPVSAEGSPVSIKKPPEPSSAFSTPHKEAIGISRESNNQLYLRVPTAESLEVQDINRETTEKAEKMQKALFETEELMNVINKLKADCEHERNEVRRIKESIHSLGGIPDTWGTFSDSSEDENEPPNNEQNGLWKRKQDAKVETKRLQLQKKSLIESISAECDACIDLRVQIKLLKMTAAN
ncbi:ral interacting protein isoform X3 [Rhodnius prolixus]|uniref:ral interacting protein isoform X3 n=1 Tax=Rhodnius prolixus TaxID=13249 RepID=UPI003D18C47E